VALPLSLDDSESEKIEAGGLGRLESGLSAYPVKFLTIGMLLD
jgi:hypothetical protein